MNSKKKVFIAGNSYNRADSTPVRLLPYLVSSFPDIEFEVFDPTEDPDFATGKKIILIDTVLGIKNVTLFKNLNSFLLSPRVTPHDFDFAVSLPLLLKLKKVAKVLIIGVPSGRKLEDIKKEVFSLIRTI